MGTILSQIFINPSTIINCNDAFKITLSLTAVPDINSNPVDIMLVLDRSGSMRGIPLANLKLAAKKFISIINESTNNGVLQPTLGSPNRIGIVSFADTATLDQPLTDNVADLDAAINALSAGGNTNHKAAFELATASYTPPSNKKIMVMMTDGVTTVGGNADQAAMDAKNDGIEIYCIGLGAVDMNQLNTWASPPKDTHVIIAPTPEDLEEAFKDLAENIILPGATNIKVKYKILDYFEILNSPAPELINPPTTTASASISNDNKSIHWFLDVLGKSTSELATLTFFAKYHPCETRTSKVTAKATYSDDNHTTISFIQTPKIVLFECCPCIHLDFKCAETEKYRCDKTVDVTLPDGMISFDLKCKNERKKICIRQKNICPNCCIVLGIAVTEIIGKKEYSRAFLSTKQNTGCLITDSEDSICKAFLLYCCDCTDQPDFQSVERTYRIYVFAHYEK